MTAKSSTADAVRASVIRRPTGAAAAARAASTLQNAEQQRPAAPAAPATPTSAAVVHEAMRTTLHLAPSARTGLKRRALDSDTTMTELIRAAISAGLQDAAGLAAASMEHRRASGGARTTLDLPRDMHRTLKRLAADEDTSVQALVVAAIMRVHPDLR